MIEALKRKLFQYATELQTTKDTLSSLEGTLEVEKREHQLTTTKLSSLLRKRSAQAPPTPQRDDSSTTDIGLLHQQIGMLQQQLRASQDGEAQLREQLAASAEQYEKLRLLTLEGFRMRRSGGEAQPETDASTSATAGETTTSSTPPNDTEDAPCAAASPSPKRAPSAMVEAVRMALQPQARPPSDAVLCAQMWRRPSEHAQPRVGLGRSRSDLSALTDAAAAATGGGAPADVVMAPANTPAPRPSPKRMPRSMSVGTDLLQSIGQSLEKPVRVQAGVSSLLSASAAVADLRGGKGLSRTPSAAQLTAAGTTAPATTTTNTAPSNVPPTSSSVPPSPRPSPRMPFGYAQGAICIEPPKRQRTVTSVLSPRIG